MITIEKLIWDDYNTGHIARHGVTQQEVEEVCDGDFYTRETHSERLLVIGPDSTGNLLAVVLGLEGDNTYYVVTARPAAKKERRRYRQLKGDPRDE